MVWRAIFLLYAMFGTPLCQLLRLSHLRHIWAYHQWFLLCLHPFLEAPNNILTSALMTARSIHPSEHVNDGEYKALHSHPSPRELAHEVQANYLSRSLRYPPSFKWTWWLGLMKHLSFLAWSHLFSHPLPCWLQAYLVKVKISSLHSKVSYMSLLPLRLRNSWCLNGMTLPFHCANPWYPCPLTR